MDQKQETTYETELNELANQYIMNCRARYLLSKDNESIAERIKELLTFRNVPQVITKKIAGEKFTLKLITKRAKVQDAEAIITKLIKLHFETIINNLRKDLNLEKGIVIYEQEAISNKYVKISIAKSISKLLIKFLRKDAIVISSIAEFKDRKWYDKYIEETDIEPTIGVTNGEGDYI